MCQIVTLHGVPVRLTNPDTLMRNAMTQASNSKTKPSSSRFAEREALSVAVIIDRLKRAVTWKTSR